MATVADSPDGAAYDYVLFDLDGTLVDTEWSYKRELFDRVGDELGRGFTDGDVTALWHGLGGDRDEMLRARDVDPVRFWDVFDELDDPRARARATFLYDDAATVGDVDGNTGVVTHCPEPVTDTVLDHLGVRDWFDAVVCCSHETGWKPNPGPVELAMQDVAPPSGGRGALVGDAESDVGAAWNAGIEAVHVERHGHSVRGRCVLGDRQLTDLADLFRR